MFWFVFWRIWYHVKLQTISYILSLSQSSFVQAVFCRFNTHCLSDLPCMLNSLNQLVFQEWTAAHTMWLLRSVCFRCLMLLLSTLSVHLLLCCFDLTVFSVQSWWCRLLVRLCGGSKKRQHIANVETHITLSRRRRISRLKKSTQLFPEVETIRRSQQMNAPIQEPKKAVDLCSWSLELGSIVSFEAVDVTNLEPPRPERLRVELTGHRQRSCACLDSFRFLSGFLSIPFWCTGTWKETSKRCCS